MRLNEKFIIAVILVLTILVGIISGVILTTNNGYKVTSTGELEESIGIESTTCIVGSDDTIEDTGCGSKYFPSE